MPSQFLPFHLPLIEDDDMRAVRDVMESGWITTGPKAAQFEQEFARYIGVRHAIAVNSGTAALHVALDAAGIGEGDEVVLPTLTFAATAEAVVYCKARPVFTDVDPDSFNLDPTLAERAITPRSRAILAVHMAGQPCDMDQLMRTAQAHGLRVIEDAAHALPARYHGRNVGTIGDMTCFSFYATKSITTGEGGMVTTESDSWAERMRIMRLHGISKDAWKRYTAEGSWRYEILAPGFKYNLTDMQAALGLTQLAKCDSMWMRRSLMAERYTEALSKLAAYELPTSRPDVQHAWHLYVIRVRRGELTIHRDRVIEELKQRGIGVSVHFIPLHLHPYYRDRWDYRPGDFPVAEDYFDRCISLPLYPAMKDEDQVRVIDALVEIARQNRHTSVPMLKEIPVAGYDSAHSAGGGEMALQSERKDDCEPQRKWQLSGVKRLLEMAGAAAALIVLFPVFVVIALAVHLSSPGPIIFRQHRAGRSGKLFDLLKFRTMTVSNVGPRVTAAGDPRITKIGRYLRTWKLDELPQLINVLKGEMSVVGPRPEVPEYVALYTAEQRQVLDFRPGITSPASLAFVDEESVLAAQSDPEDYYARVLVPQKLAADLKYCRKASLSGDLRIIAATVCRLLPGRRSRELSSTRTFVCIGTLQQTTSGDSQAA